MPAWLPAWLAAGAVQVISQGLLLSNSTFSDNRAELLGVAIQVRACVRAFMCACVRDDC